jgi:hypothetical protein
MNLVCCIDENYSATLLNLGFKLLNKTIIDSKPCWIFKPKSQFDLSDLDKSKIFTTTKMLF